jgi:hypothetical protein
MWPAQAQYAQLICDGTHQPSHWRLPPPFRVENKRGILNTLY